MVRESAHFQGFLKARDALHAPQVDLRQSTGVRHLPITLSTQVLGDRDTHLVVRESDIYVNRVLTDIHHLDNRNLHTL